MTAGSLSDLQRTVGNKGTTALVRAGSTPARQRAAVQRDAKPGTTEFKMPGPSKVLKDHPDFQRHGTKVLAAGTMKWSLVITTGGMFPSKYTGDPSATIQVVFTPLSTGHTISFLQTVAQSQLDTGKTGKTRLDVLPDDFDPFYGAQWDPTSLTWTPEGAPERYRNAPSSPADPSGYLYDEPSVPPRNAKMFETVAVQTDTGAVLGALRWGVGGGKLLFGGDADCTDRPVGEFAAAVESFYATPTSGTPPDSGPRFRAILDEFGSNDADLTAEHRHHLDLVVADVKKAGKDRKLRLLVAGFGDAMDSDPKKASQQRTDAAVRYLTAAGVPANIITPTSFGSSWARAPVSMKEGRNRRVQVRLRDITGE